MIGARRRGVRVALVGAGAWGQNILRVLAAHPRVALAAVIDTSREARERAGSRAGGVALFSSIAEASHLSLDAAVIATPAGLHAQNADEALRAGLDVLVEKPLATSPDDADGIVALARARGRIAMVGHLLLYHPAVVALLALCREGALGQPRALGAARRSPPSRSVEISVLWSLGPHDLSVLHALDPSPVRRLSARSGPGRPAEVADEVSLDLSLASGLAARVELSSRHIRKERRLLLGGDEATAIFDDLVAGSKLTVMPRAKPEECHEARGRLALHGTPRAVAVAPGEPLALEIDHFIDCVEGRTRPRSPAEDGALIVRWLREAELAAARSLEDGHEGAQGASSRQSPPSGFAP